LVVVEQVGELDLLARFRLFELGPFIQVTTIGDQLGLCVHAISSPLIRWETTLLFKLSDV
jgi:hypothetical protein